MSRCVLFLILTYIFMFTNGVASDDDTVRDNNKILRGRYNFNHPPSVENYDPIPVAVVYDDDNGGISDKPKEYKNNLKTRLLNTDSTEKTSQLPESTTIKAKLKPRRLTASQIPVAVTYDDSSVNDKKNNGATTIRPRKASEIRRRTGHKINSDVPRNQVNKGASTEQTVKKPAGNIKPRTFPKRLSGRDPIVPIVDSESYVFSHSGNFHYRYQSGDGSRAYSEGELKKVNQGRGEAVRGGFSYTDQDGNDFSISYTADENGYRPVGAHLPTPPPIPPEIARALEYLATATTPEPVTKRSKPNKHYED